MEEEVKKEEPDPDLVQVKMQKAVTLAEKLDSVSENVDKATELIEKSAEGIEKTTKLMDKVKNFGESLVVYVPALTQALQGFVP